MTTPREWWIKRIYPGTLCWETEVTVCSPAEWIKDCENWDDFIRSDCVHVIEHAAYQNLEQELAEEQACTRSWITKRNEDIRAWEKELAEAKAGHIADLQLMGSQIDQIEELKAEIAEADAVNKNLSLVIQEGIDNCCKHTKELAEAKAAYLKVFEREGEFIRQLDELIRSRDALIEKLIVECVKALEFYADHDQLGYRSKAREALALYEAWKEGK